MKILKYLNKDPAYVMLGTKELKFTEGSYLIIPDQIDEKSANYLARKQKLSYAIVESDAKPSDIPAEQVKEMEPDFELASDLMSDIIDGSDTVDESQEEPEIDLDNLKLRELRDLAKERGLPVYGGKQQLIERIKEAM